MGANHRKRVPLVQYCFDALGLDQPRASPPLTFLTLSPVMRMGLPRPSRIFLVFLALVAVSTVTSAQSPSVLGPRKLISDSGQPLPDNALLLPLNGQQASNNRLDGLLVLSGLRSRQQQVTCTTNYTACQGTDFCCPNGNMCCSGESSRFSAQRILGGDVGDDSSCDSVR